MKIDEQIDFMNTYETGVKYNFYKMDENRKNICMFYIFNTFHNDNIYEN